MQIITSKGKFRKAFTITELAFVVVIIVAFILLLTPFVSDIRNRTNVVGCEENLQKIGTGLKLYASQHDGQFPVDLATLSKDGYVKSEKVFDCPAAPEAGTAENPDYQYTKGYTILSPSENIVVSGKTGSHKNGKYVLYVDGTIAWLAD